MSAALELRQAIRRGNHTGLTTGFALGFVQANLVVLPKLHANDFLRYCEQNSAACPVLGVSDVGSPLIPALGSDLDVRSDLPGYVVHRAGNANQEVASIAQLWRDDLVAVAIGCWFSMEDALTQVGVRLRHVELGIQGPLFKTHIQTRSAGIFAGPLVVSMRPFALESVETVCRVTSRFRRVHGGPVHQGDHKLLGIADLSKPDFGEALPPLPGEVALYWACGLTAAVALQQSGVGFFITQAPGKMLVTDCLNDSLKDSVMALWETAPESVFNGKEHLC